MTGSKYTESGLQSLYRGVSSIFYPQKVLFYIFKWQYFIIITVIFPFKFYILFKVIQTLFLFAPLTVLYAILTSQKKIHMHQLKVFDILYFRLTAAL